MVSFHVAFLFSDFQICWFSKCKILILDSCDHSFHWIPCGPLRNESILEVLFFFFFHFILKFSFVEIPYISFCSIWRAFSFQWLRTKWIHFELRKWHSLFFFLCTWEICFHNYISVKPPNSHERLAVFSFSAIQLYNLERKWIKKCGFADCFEYYRILL